MAMPIHAPSRFGGRDYNNETLPPISSRHDGFGGRPFGVSHILSPSAASNPMAISGREDNTVPPPLPPPRLVPHGGPLDPAVQLKENMHPRDYTDSPMSDSFGLSFERRPWPSRNPLDEGYQSIGSSIRSQAPSLRPSFGNSQTSSIDSSMLDKLNRRPAFSASVNENSAPRPSHTQLPALSLPHRSKPAFEPTFAKSPVPTSALSSRPSPLSFASTNASHGYRSPTTIGIEPDYERSRMPRGRRTTNGSIADDITISTQGSYEREDEDFPMEETSRMRSLNIEDPWREARERDRDRDREREMDYYQPGQKRRASSPPVDEIAPLPSDVLRRRDGNIISRGSPTPRLSVIPQGSTMSPISRNGSYVSSLSAGMATYGRRSPNPMSPGAGAVSPTDAMSCHSPYPTPISLTASPRSSISRASVSQPLPHQRGLSDASRGLASPRKLAEIPKSGSSLVAAKLRGPYMCECCPKKPKKFETEEELKLHEAEKQYECSFCGNRFKNKNEAERHQNSLHVRRHSWSCSALTSYERAFHDSTTRPGEADTCGYCGDEFPRSGRTPGGGITISEPDWEERIHHLQDVHKFGECNSSKKFYRADHFRQHLKHSHAGTSGKWTNMLENACMMEEDPPVVGGGR